MLNNATTKIGKTALNEEGYYELLISNDELNTLIENSYVDFNGNYKHHNWFKINCYSCNGFIIKNDKITFLKLHDGLEQLEIFSGKIV